MGFKCAQANEHCAYSFSKVALIILNMPLFKTLAKVPALGTLESYNAKFKRINLGIKNVFIQKRPTYQQEWQ